VIVMIRAGIRTARCMEISFFLSFFVGSLKKKKSIDQNDPKLCWEVFWTVPVVSPLTSR